MAKIRAGVIGLGMGRNHIKGYQSHPEACVAAIADLDGDRLREIGDAFGVEARYTSPEEMLDKEKLDVVSIATPNAFHRSLAVLAFEHGCHVLSEKPMAMNAAEGQEMIDAAAKADRRLMINFSFRFTPQSMALKREVESGILGDVYFGRTVWHRRRGMPKFGGWFGQKDLSGGGPLIDLGVHRLDLALWLMGYPEPEWVMGSAYDYLGSARAKREGAEFNVEDLASGYIRFKNGATLVLEASWAANIKEKELMITRLLGTNGGLVQRNLNEGYDFEAEIYYEKDGSLFDLKLSPSSPAAPSAMYHLVDSIIADSPHTATGGEGLTVMRLLDAIYESAGSRQPVRLS